MAGPAPSPKSTEDAFFTGFNTINPVTGKSFNAQGDFLTLNAVAALPLPGATATDEEREAWNRQHRFADPEFPADEPFGITNLPRLPAYRIDSGQMIDAVVVKPDPVLEAADSRIRPMLHRVAAAAEQVNGHYRFYSYTDARISLTRAWLGRRGPGQPAPGRWCARALSGRRFSWANAQLPRIEVEGRVTEHAQELLPSPFVDGLYRYLTDEREKAANALHSLVSEKVRNEV